MVGFKKFIWIAVVFTLGGFACQKLQATPTGFPGLLNIVGSGPGPAGSSVSLDFFNAKAGGGTDSFDSIAPNTPVAIASPSMFFDKTSVASSLWTVGGFTLDLDFTSRVGDRIFGTAMIVGPGIQPFSGVEWIYTSHIGGTFTFQLIPGIPDSGSTILLLGVGLVTIAVCRQRFAKS